MARATTNTAIRGSLVEETFAILAAWDFSISRQENCIRIHEGNVVRAKSEAWLKKITMEVFSRFTPESKARALALLAKEGYGLEKWKPLLLWHLAQTDYLVREFLVSWLFKAYDDGILYIRPMDLRPFLLSVKKHGKNPERAWTESTIEHVAEGLVKIAADFGLLSGAKKKEFTSYHLPDESFIYILHLMQEKRLNARRIIDSPDWRIFLMRPGDVERELLRLHQFRRLEYQAAGTFAQLTLPCRTALEYAERILE